MFREVIGLFAAPVCVINFDNVLW